MKLNLKRPIVFFDIESTGLNTEIDRIVELALIKLNPNGTREHVCSKYNPEMPIPKEASDIHGITDEDVKHAPLLKDHAPAILEFFEGCDIGGFNSNKFDIPMLYNEMIRVGLYFDYKKANLIDVGNIFKIKEERTLSAAVKFYLDKDLDNAHSALADIEGTLDVFLAQVERYEDLPNEMDKLALFCNYGKQVLDLTGKFIQDENGNILLNFGKHKGCKAKDQLGFLEWMCYKASFPKDATDIALSIIHS